MNAVHHHGELRFSDEEEVEALEGGVRMDATPRGGERGEDSIALDDLVQRGQQGSRSKI